MRHAVLVAIGLAACGSPSRLDETGSGSSIGSDQTEHVVMLLRQYTLELVPIMRAWDGNCDAQITRMLTLEPLVGRIRAASIGLDEAELHERMAVHKAEVHTEVDAILAKQGKSISDVEANETAIKSQCGSDPKFQDAMDRIGVFKKKSKSP